MMSDVQEAATAAPVRSAMAFTLASLAAAFAAWERGYRAAPAEFLSAEECAAMEVDQLSADRAAYLLQLLRELSQAGRGDVQLGVVAGVDMGADRLEVVVQPEGDASHG